MKLFFVYFILIIIIITDFCWNLNWKRARRIFLCPRNNMQRKNKDFIVILYNNTLSNSLGMETDGIMCNLYSDLGIPPTHLQRFSFFRNICQDTKCVFYVHGILKTDTFCRDFNVSRHFSYKRFFLIFIFHVYFYIVRGIKKIKIQFVRDRNTGLL